MPYGSRDPEEIFSFVVPIFEELIQEGCKVIVVACNTVSTTLIVRLRDRFKDFPFVAIEPMIKPAAEMTKTGVIAVCATPTTLASSRYKELKDEYTKHVKVLEPDCSDWARMIEQSEVEEKELAKRINEVLDGNADVIVLGCTHYHWIEDEINQLAANRAIVIQPTNAIIEQLKRVLVLISE